MPARDPLTRPQIADTKARKLRPAHPHPARSPPRRRWRGRGAPLVTTRTVVSRPVPHHRTCRPTIAWRTGGRICERVMADQKQGRDLFADVRRLGFDEISVRKGQKYLTVVVDHHSGRLLWAHAGRDRRTVEKFLDLLGDERCARIELVSCDD